MASSMWSMFGIGSSGQADTEDLSALLRAILPTFITIVERARECLPEPDLLSAEDLPQPDDPSTKQRDFYLRLNTVVVNLHAILVQWDPAELVESMSADEAEMKKHLENSLNQLENRFRSRTADKAGLAFERLGMERRPGETFWKLRALKRILPDNYMPGEEALRHVVHIIRMDNKSSEKRERLLRTLGQACDFFYNLQLSREEPDATCPIRFVNYPMKHVSNLTKTLFNVVKTNWCCQCPGNTSHAGRRTRLSLTKHQRFETAPVGPSIFYSREARFRVLFPTSRDLEWQDTEIRVNTREYVGFSSCHSYLGLVDEIDSHEHTEHLKVNGLCGIIQGVRARIRPRMVIYAKQLWQLQADIEDNPQLSTQLRDAEFVSLKQLLKPIRGKEQSLISSTDPKDRLILSFVLATSLLHFYSGPWLQTNITSETICFLAPRGNAKPDLTRPYLTTSISSHTLGAAPRELNRPHRFPDVLFLGVTLLEIERGASIEVDETQDACVVALEYLDKWKKGCRSNRSRSVPEGLYRAIMASIDPRECRNRALNKTGVNDFDVRKYIFERILHPLEDALSTAYEVELHMLHTETDKQAADVGLFDHHDEDQRAKLDASKEWFQYLDGVHDLYSECEDRCEGLKGSTLQATRVKIAVLDTGLQLPGGLQANYEDDERINVTQSESFVPPSRRGASHDWRTDSDGHGSKVGQIILQVALGAEIHVAKVFQTREDLASEDRAAQVHKSIAEAIKRATEDWNVDMVVMCFGFDEPIPLIKKALDEASKAEKPPLFFAATRNSGAHEEMAWPAKDMSVIGISSTDGYGTPSSFNPHEGYAHPILYALGEGVPVKVGAPGDPDGYVVKYVSGTSYATPVAAALVANLLGCVRMLVATSSREDREIYGHLPLELQRMSGILPVLRRRMQKKHRGNFKSLLPWDFLKVDLLKGNRLLEDVAETVRKG